MKSCDYYTEKNKKRWCMIKDSEISDDTYRDYCKCDERKKCIIWTYYEKEGRR